MRSRATKMSGIVNLPRARRRAAHYVALISHASASPSSRPGSSSCSFRPGGDLSRIHQGTRETFPSLQPTEGQTAPVITSDKSPPLIRERELQQPAAASTRQGTEKVERRNDSRQTKRERKLKKAYRRTSVTRLLILSAYNLRRYFQELSGQNHCADTPGKLTLKCTGFCFWLNSENIFTKFCVRTFFIIGHYVTLIF